MQDISILQIIVKYSSVIDYLRPIDREILHFVQDDGDTFRVTRQLRHVERSETSLQNGR